VSILGSRRASESKFKKFQTKDTQIGEKFFRKKEKEIISKNFYELN